MGSPVMRISPWSKEKITTLAADLGTTPQAIVDEAIEHYRRERIIEAINEDFASLRARPADFARVEAERARWATFYAGRNQAQRETVASASAPAEAASSAGTG